MACCHERGHHLHAGREWEEGSYGKFQDCQDPETPTWPTNERKPRWIKIRFRKWMTRFWSTNLCFFAFLQCLQPWCANQRTIGIRWINHACITYISLILSLSIYIIYHLPRKHGCSGHGDEIWAMHHGGWDLPYSTCPPVRPPGTLRSWVWSDVRSLGKISQNLPQRMGKKWKKYEEIKIFASSLFVFPVTPKLIEDI